MPSRNSATLAHQLRSVPDELKEHPQWIAWKYVADPGRPKRKKLPLSPGTGRAASVMDSAAWGSFEDALEFCQRDDLEGIGFVFTADDALCGIDLDGCVDPATGELRDASVQLIDELDSYTELSPSGSGVHIIVKARLPGRGRKTGGVEMYDQGRFFTVTGESLGTPRPVTKRQRQIDRLYESLEHKRGSKSVQRESRGLSGPELPDATVLDLIRASKRAAVFEALYTGRWKDRHDSQSEADLALVGLIADFVGNNPAQIDRLFRGSALYRPKWEEQRGEYTYGERTIVKALGE